MERYKDKVKYWMTFSEINNQVQLMFLGAHGLILVIYQEDENQLRYYSRLSIISQWLLQKLYNWVGKSIKFQNWLYAGNGTILARHVIQRYTC